ncbi:UNVERIFIED_CONTAM: hypothetical protein Sangu_2761800 [Sesamum angustifolium]|uniref:Late embryogenesis abundant protein LEA-2 subgroup domain-containing protein n=1 Tax=Sesamum angustifolium TaxID=2727405 RepID=A0AAW2IWU0_9LAMI
MLGLHSPRPRPAKHSPPNIRPRRAQNQDSHSSVISRRCKRPPLRPHVAQRHCRRRIRLHNMNFGRFKFRGGNTTFLYDNATVGVTAIYDGRVGSREKREMSVSVKVMASDRQLSDNSVDFSRDVDSGLIKLRSLAKLKGEVRVVKIINRHTTAVMDCTMALNLTGQAIQDLLCQ